jgi:hypothetical protein
MKWLTNIYDPRKTEEAKRSLCLSFDEASDPQGRERAWQRHLEWLADKVVGRPQASGTYTVEELEVMGLVGVYSREEITETLSVQ